MKKRSSASAVLEEILNELDGDRKPSDELRKRGRAALRGVSRSLKAATAAAAASGNSGRKPKYDRDAIRTYITMNPGIAVAEVARIFSCSATLVSIIRKESRESK